MRINPAFLLATMMAAALASGGGPVPAAKAEELHNQAPDLARHLGGGSGGGLDNKRFCDDMAARALPDLKPATNDPTVLDGWRMTRNDARRARQKPRTRCRKARAAAKRLARRTGAATL